jgi:MFS family permease
MTEQPSLQAVAPPGWARAARPIALAAWVLAALAPGVAAALAQYASLASGRPSPLYTVALLIVCLGLGLAVLGWLFWVVVGIRLRRAGYRFGQSTVRGTLIALLGGVALLVAGAVLAAWGGNSDSLALPALLALGLGVAGVVGGVLMLLWSLRRLVVRDTHVRQARREQEKARREFILETARRQGRDTTALRRTLQWLYWWITLEAVGTAVGGVLLLGNSLFVVPVASLLHLSAVGAAVLVLVVGAPLAFASLRALLIVGYRAYTLAPEAALKWYALWTAATLTTAFLLFGILVDTSLACLSPIPVLTLLFLEPKLRKRSGV